MEFVQAPSEAEEKQMMEGEGETVETTEPEVVEEKEPEVKVETPVVEEKKKPSAEEIAENLKAALKETREEMKAIKRKADLADELKREFEAYRSSQKPKEPEAKIPAYEEDPLGHLKSETENFKKAQEQLREQLKAVNETTETQRISNYVNSLEADFRKSNPDYDPAFQHLIGVQKKQMELSGIPEEQIGPMLAQQAANFSRQAISQGKNPAQLIYEYAKLYGYKTPAPVEEKPKVDDAVARLETVQKGLEKATKTLSKGGKTEVPASVQQLIDAKGEDFDRLWKELFEK